MNLKINFNWNWKNWLSRNFCNSIRKST